MSKFLKFHVRYIESFVTLKKEVAFYELISEEKNSTCGKKSLHLIFPAEAWLSSRTLVTCFRVFEIKVCMQVVKKA
jgi:hypothetical protein